MSSELFSWLFKTEAKKGARKTMFNFGTGLKLNVSLSCYLSFLNFYNILGCVSDKGGGEGRRTKVVG